MKVLLLVLKKYRIRMINIQYINVYLYDKSHLYLFADKSLYIL